MRTSRLVEVKKKKKKALTTFVTDQHTRDKRGAVSNGVRAREREGDSCRPFEIIFPFGPKYLCNEKSYQRDGKKLLRKKGTKMGRDVDSNTMSRLLNYI